MLEAPSWLAVAACLAGAPAVCAQTSPPESGPPEEAPPPKLVIKGFGNIDFHNDFDTNGEQSFSLGELDLFVTSELTDNLSFLTEIVFEPLEDEERIVDIERYQIEYSRSDLLNVALGRMHTMLGFWNHAYHHGAWFQTTTHRPEIYEFEDEGGVLPVHELGVRVSGSRGVGHGRLEYSVSLTNGRGPVAHRFENLRDFDRHKAVNLWVGASPGVPGLTVGGALRFDRIPIDPEDPARAVPLSERIVGTFLAFQPGRTTLLGEVLLVEHQEIGGLERRYRTSGFYVQGSRRIGRFTPYYRFEGLDRAPGDPYYPSSDDLRRHVAGLRVDPWPWAALKFEFNHDQRDPGSDGNRIIVQAACTF
jgi:hypothetical protein